MAIIVRSLFLAMKVILNVRTKVSLLGTKSLTAIALALKIIRVLLVKVLPLVCKKLIFHAKMEVLFKDLG